MLTYKNPTNGYKETIEEISKLWATLFGPAYFAVRGVWSWAVIAFIISFITLAISPIVYLIACVIIGLNAPTILEKHYNKMGWKLMKAKS